MGKCNCITELAIQGCMDKCTSADSYDWLSVYERSRHARCVRQL